MGGFFNYKLMKFVQKKIEIEYMDPVEVYKKYADDKYSFLLESRAISHIYGRFSLIGLNPILELSGKEEEFEIRVINKRGVAFLDRFKANEELLVACEVLEVGKDFISGKIIKSGEETNEENRIYRKNIAQVLRFFLKEFQMDESTRMGLYGAISYDFVRLFEDIEEQKEKNEVRDFRFFLYDSFVFFDHLKEKAEFLLYRSSEEEFDEFEFIENKYEGNQKFEVNDVEFEMSKSEFETLVENARDLAKQGEVFEVVYSHTLKASYKGDPFLLYERYRNLNPSPYLFYFDFGDEYLVGASPEMMIRCENNLVHMRPISGTAIRSEDPIEDHENMLSLLKCEKERSELDMLIDLGRNDLARICRPGIKISDYRFVEKYSKVMHTIAHLTGELREGCIALDALISSLNAGTLTGAPKVRAMQAIEDNETSRRGYYGGSVGYLTLSGEMDTAIIIRTAHLKNGNLSFRMGATLLNDSNPEKEYQETMNKAAAFLNTIEYEV